jgi:hypothetical protein
MIAASAASFKNVNLSDRASFESVNFGDQAEFWVDLGAGMGAINSPPELFLPLCINNILFEGFFDYSG